MHHIKQGGETCARLNSSQGRAVHGWRKDLIGWVPGPPSRLLRSVQGAVVFFIEGKVCACGQSGALRDSQFFSPVHVLP